MQNLNSNQWSKWLLVNPLITKNMWMHSYHAFSNCFNPYSDFFNLHTRCFWPFCSNPLWAQNCTHICFTKKLTKKDLIRPCKGSSQTMRRKEIMGAFTINPSHRQPREEELRRNFEEGVWWNLRHKTHEEGIKAKIRRVGCGGVKILGCPRRMGQRKERERERGVPRACWRGWHFLHREREGVRLPGGSAAALRHDYNGALWEEDRCPCGGWCDLGWTVGRQENSESVLVVEAWSSGESEGPMSKRSHREGTLWVTLRDRRLLHERREEKDPVRETSSSV